MVRIGLAGATSGLFTTPILAPGERLKCVLQVQGAKVASGEWAKPKYGGPMDVVKKLYAEGGLRSVNRCVLTRRAWCRMRLRLSPFSTSTVSPRPAR